MSSHHIVRDEQEPALLIIEPHAVQLDFIQQLLEWSPTVVVIEQALDQVLSWGIKIDVVVCTKASFDRASAQTVDQYPVEVVAVDDHLLDQALKYLYQHNHRAVNIISSFEQDLIKPEVLAKMDVIVFNHHFKVFYVAKGDWKKWVTIDTLFQVLPVATDAPPHTKNLEPVTNDDNVVYLKPAQEGFIQISHPQADFWVFEKIGE